MNINRISANNAAVTKPSFTSQYVTLSEKNLGQDIAKNVVDNFNGKILPELKKTQKQECQEIINSAGAGKVISKPEDFQNNVNFFVLAAGSGSRFKALAKEVGNYNKISLPFKIGKKENIHMLDFAMTMGKYFIDDKGSEKIISSVPSGSFGDIIKHYQAGNPIKDTIVCCGDNVFGDKSSEIMSFFTKAMNNPNKHVALVGVGRAPEVAAKRFGVLEAADNNGGDVLKLKGFSEKPELEEAKKLAVNGENITNTGLFYISKEAMEKLMEEFNRGENHIKKNDTELYDFANAVKYVHSKLPEWFGVESTEGADIKVVKTWEDVGEPKALYSFANEVKNGQFLQNFPKKLANKIKKSFEQRVHLNDEKPYINFSDSTKVSKEKIEKSNNIEGVNIVV